MSDTTLGMQIGSVISYSGSVWAVSGTSQRQLSEGAPVYKGEEIVTEADSNVEIKFIDDSVLGQGADSAVVLNDYVFSGEDSLLDFRMVRGVLRMASGEIVKENPENFNLSTPLATIGIRGTEILVHIDQNREFIGVDKMGAGHTVVVSNAFNQVVIDRPGMFSGVDFDGSLIQPDEMPASFLASVVRAVPLTILGDPPRSPGDPQDVILPQGYHTIDNHTGEIRPGVGQEFDHAGDGHAPRDSYVHEDAAPPTEADIDAALAMETAAGGPTPGSPLDSVVDIDYVALASGDGDGGDGTPDAPPDDGTPEAAVMTDGGDQTTETGTPPPETVAEAVPADPAPDGQDAPPADPAPPPARDPAPAPAPSADPEPGTDTPVLLVVQDASEENETVAVQVLADDPGATLVSAEALDDAPGEVSFAPDGTLTYTPAPGETGTVSIDYVVADGDGYTTPARLTIELAADSEPAVSVASVTVDESGGLTTAEGLLAAAFGADAAGASLALAADGATWDAETATLSADNGDWTIQVGAGGYVFTQLAPLDHPDDTDPDDALVTQVTVTATDADGSFTIESFTVTVRDDGPDASDATFTQDTEAGTQASFDLFAAGVADTGLDGGALTGAALAAESTFQGDVTYTADGTISYTPVAGETGTVAIDYMVTDGDGDTASASLFINLAESQDAGYIPGGGGEVIVGSDGDDVLDGGSGRDVIFGTGGDDELIGGNSRDAILGGNGEDTLLGGNGNDLLIGGAGDDELTGGKGGDTFVFTSPSDGWDVILDFEASTDTILLYRSGFDLGDAGDLNPGRFIVLDAAAYMGGADFGEANSGLVYASDAGSCTGTLYYDPDATVCGDEVVLATLNENDGTNLLAGDIELA